MAESQESVGPSDQSEPVESSIDGPSRVRQCLGTIW
jgi:hypothetical protein